MEHPGVFAEVELQEIIGFRYFNLPDVPMITFINIYKMSLPKSGMVFEK